LITVISWLILCVCLGFDSRFQAGPVSFTVGELGAVLFCALSLASPGLYRWRLRRDQVVLTIVMALSMAIAVSRAPDTWHALSAVRDALLPVTLFLVVCALPLNGSQALNVSRMMILVASLVASLGIAQYTLGFPTIPHATDYSSWAASKSQVLEGFLLANSLGFHGTFAFGTYAHPNTLAEYLISPLLAVIGLLIFRAELGIRRGESWLLGGAGILLLTGILMTFARTVIALIPSGSTLLWLQHRRTLTPARIVAIGGAFLIAGLLFVNSGILDPLQTGSARGRGLLLASAWQMVSERPETILGGATQMFLSHYYRWGQVVHQVFLYFTFQHGLLAAMGLLVLTAGVCRESALAGKVAAPVVSRAIAVTGGTCVFLLVYLYGQTAPYLDSVQSGLNLWLWASLSTKGAKPMDST
jgi:hypothetical protein